MFEFLFLLFKPENWTKTPIGVFILPPCGFPSGTFSSYLHYKAWQQWKEVLHCFLLLYKNRMCNWFRSQGNWNKRCIPVMFGAGLMNTQTCCFLVSNFFSNTIHSFSKFFNKLLPSFFFFFFGVFQPLALLPPLGLFYASVQFSLVNHVLSCLASTV